VRAASHSRTSRFGAVPSERRPSWPERRICTKLRNMRASSITRGKICARRRVSRTASTAQSSAGTSFIGPRSRQYTAVFAMNSGVTCSHSASSVASCCSAEA